MALVSPDTLAPMESSAVTQCHYPPCFRVASVYVCQHSPLPSLRHIQLGRAIHGIVFALYNVQCKAS
jgi:hypothetical protein